MSRGNKGSCGLNHLFRNSWKEHSLTLWDNAKNVAAVNRVLIESVSVAQFATQVYYSKVMVQESHLYGKPNYDVPNSAAGWSREGITNSGLALDKNSPHPGEVCQSGHRKRLMSTPFRKDEGDDSALVVTTGCGQIPPIAQMQSVGHVLLTLKDQTLPC